MSDAEKNNNPIFSNIPGFRENLFCHKISSHINSEVIGHIGTLLQLYLCISSIALKMTLSFFKDVMVLQRCFQPIDKSV